jgi:signal transduction histidine kinase
LSKAGAILGDHYAGGRHPSSRGRRAEKRVAIGRFARAADASDIGLDGPEVAHRGPQSKLLKAARQDIERLYRIMENLLNASRIEDAEILHILCRFGIVFPSFISGAWADTPDLPTAAHNSRGFAAEIIHLSGH